MKKNTLLMKANLFLMCFPIVGFTYAQKGEDKDVTVHIKTVEVVNGETTTNEQTLTGEEALEYYQNNHTYKLEDQGNVNIEVIKKELNENTDEENASVQKNVTIIKTHSKNGQKPIDDAEMIEEIKKHISHDGKKIVVSSSSSEGNHEDSFSMSIEEDKIVYKDENGEEKIIDLTNSKGSKTKKVIIINETVEIDEDTEHQNKKGKKSHKKSKSIESTESSMNVYPNPNKGNFDVELDPKGKGQTQLDVIDLNGKTVFSKTIEEEGVQKINIDLKEQSPGTYYVRMKQEGELLTRKIVIK